MRRITTAWMILCCLNLTISAQDSGSSSNELSFEEKLANAYDQSYAGEYQAAIKQFEEIQAEMDQRAISGDLDFYDYENAITELQQNYDMLRLFSEQDTSYQKLKEFYEHTLPILESVNGTSGKTFINFRNELIAIYNEEGLTKQAAQLQKDQRKDGNELTITDHLEQLISEIDEALEINDKKTAIKKMQETIELAAENFAQNRIIEQQYFNTLYGVKERLNKLHEYKTLGKILEMDVGLMREVFGINHHYYADAQTELAYWYFDQGKQKKGKTIIDSYLNNDSIMFHNFYHKALYDFAKLYRKHNIPGQEPLLKRLVEVSLLRKKDDYYRFDYKDHWIEGIVAVYSLADYYVQNNQLEKALALDTAVDELNHGVAFSGQPSWPLFDLAVLFKEAGKYQLAEKYYRFITSEFRNIHRPDWVHTMLRTIAFYRETNQPEKIPELISKNSHIEEIEWKDDLLYPSVINVIQDYFDLAYEYMKYDEPDFGIRLTREKLLSGKPEVYASQLIDLAIKLEYSGKFDEAQAILEESMELIREFGTPKDQATTAFYLAHNSITLGRYEEGKKILDDSYPYSEGHPIRGQFHNAYGRYYRIIGAYQEAEANFLTAISLLNEFNEDAIYVKYNLGWLYMNLGQYERAEQYITEALTKLPAHQEAFLSLAETHFFLKKYEEARKYLRKGIDYIQLNYSADHADLISFYTRLGDISLTQNQYDDAESWFNKAHEVLEIRSPARDLNWSSYYKGMQQLEIIRGNYPAARNYLDSAMQLTRTYLTTQHPSFSIHLFDLAKIYSAEKNLTSAFEKYQEANQLFINQIDTYFPFLSEREKADYYHTIRDRFEIFNSFAVSFYNDNPKVSGEMYDLQLSTKSLLFKSVNKVRDRIMNSGDQEAIKQFTIWRRWKEQLALLMLEQKNRDDFEDLNLSDTVETTSNISARIDSLTESINRMEKKLSLRSEQFVRESEQEKHTWKEIVNHLKPGEAAVELVRFRDFDFESFDFTDEVRYAALIVKATTTTNPELLLLEKGSELEGKYLNAYRNMINFDLESNVLYKQYWEPIQNRLDGIHKVYLSPDGVYHQINLNTLYNEDSSQHVIEEITIRQVSNTGDLIETITESKVNDSAILLGNPDFGAPQDTSINRSVPYYLNLERNIKLSSLPGTVDEVLTINQVLKTNEWQTKVYLDKQAREGQVKSIQAPKVLHIATHGFFESDRSHHLNPLLRSGLMFTGAANGMLGKGSFGTEDGILTAFEAKNMNLSGTELVVLSACETGLGEIQNGEGVYGLQRAFRIAGAQSILISLWQVNDHVTNELMQEFYKNWLIYGDKHQAFHDAQLTIKSEYRHPKYWGAFVLIGPEETE